MEKYDWSKFRLRIPVNAGVQRIYDHFNTRNGLETWFLREANFKKPGNKSWTASSIIEKGDEYEWRWYGHPDETTERGKVTEANGHDRFQFTFAGDCLVTISVKPEKEYSMVELVQENIPEDEKSKASYHVGCMEGWTFYLSNLKSIIESGFDLRNKNPEIKNVINS